MATDVILILGDCLREANSSAETLPFISNISDIRANNCFAPGTWTLPTHASLYTSVYPHEHGVTRRGDQLSEAQPTVPTAARREGYVAALFSENPSFGPANGFKRGLDYCDAEIDLKLFSSDYSISESVGQPKPAAAMTALRDIEASPKRLKDCANLVYGFWKHLRSKHPHEFPHNGERVLKHLGTFQEQTTNPLFAFVNLLEPHNPHHSRPPERGSHPLGLEVSRSESEALADVRAKDAMFTDEEPPATVKEHFSTWDEVYKRQEEIYEGQIRYMDSILKDWVRDYDGFNDSLVILTGDHGHMFFEEGLVGHHSSLHPCGVQVPLFVSTPAEWGTGKTIISEPMSLISLMRGIDGVLTGQVESQSQFIAELTTDDPIITVADGPNWPVESLYETYGGVVDKVATKRVGIVTGDQMVVYERCWRSDKLYQNSYQITAQARELHERELIETTGYTNIDEWILSKRESSSASVTQRLEALGYV